MDNSIRLQYLSAMGIDVWVPRESENIVLPEDQVPDVEQDNWTALQTELLACQDCELCQSRQQVLIGTGDQQADFFLVTDAPSADDEQRGMPFADQSADLLTEMLRAMQLSRELVYISNIVKCRPPEDRDPKQQELATCAAYLQRQIALVKPKVLIAVGRIAAQALLQSKAPLAELRGIEYQFSGIPLVVIYHPAYLLRALTEKPKAWQDMQMALTLFNKTKNNDKTSVEPT